MRLYPLIQKMNRNPALWCPTRTGGEVRYKRSKKISAIIPLNVHVHDIFFLRFYRFYGIIQILKDPRQKIYEIFEILIQICTDIKRFRSINIFAASRQLSIVLSPKTQNLFRNYLLNCTFFHCLLRLWPKSGVKMGFFGNSSELN